jgi:hypothetical protein
VEVRNGAINDADTAKLVTGREVRGREGGQGQTEPPGKREVYELC